jgi:glycosyltransferase involved in cell wall biosynthesis
MVLPRCYVLVRGRNASRYLKRCLESIRKQTYSNIQVLFVDDASDYNREYKKSILSLLSPSDVIIWRKERFYSVRNGYEVIHQYCDQPEGVVFSLDADDWLASEQSIGVLMQSYAKNNWYFTYGNCFIWSGDDSTQVLASSIEELNRAYPKKVVENKSFRDHPFLPLQPGTWKVHAFKSIPREAFLRKNGKWLWYCQDQVIFFPLLEMYFPRCGVISEPLSVYNKENPNSDSKEQLIASLKDELEVRSKQLYAARDC